MTTYKLTETLHYVAPRGGVFDTGGGPASIFPGLVNGDDLRAEIGDEFFEYLVSLGRLIPDAAP